MRNSRRDFNPFEGADGFVTSIDLESGRSDEDKEKLSGLIVIMPCLGRPRLHSFVDDAQRFLFQQMPAVTSVSPNIVFGVMFTDSIYEFERQAWYDENK